MEEYKDEILEEEEVELPEALFRVETLLDAQSQKEASLAVRGKSGEAVGWFFMGICVVMLGVLLWRYFSAEVRQNNQLFLMALLVFSMGMYLYNKFLGQKKALRRWEENLRRQFGSP